MLCYIFRAFKRGPGYTRSCNLQRARGAALQVSPSAISTFRPPPGWGPHPGFHDLVEVRYRLGMPNRGLVGARDPPARTLPGGRGPRDSIQVTLIYPATRGIRRWGAPAPAAHVGGGGMADMRQKPVRRRGGRQRTPTWPVMVLTCSNRSDVYVNCSTWSIARPPAAPRRRRARSRGACPIWAG